MKNRMFRTINLKAIILTENKTVSMICQFHWEAKIATTKKEVQKVKVTLIAKSCKTTHFAVMVTNSIKLTCLGRFPLN